MLKVDKVDRKVLKVDKVDKKVLKIKKMLKIQKNCSKDEKIVEEN